MDDLELLKQDWQREKPNEFPHYSEKELFQMSKKNSVSVIKYILMIGIAEILLWTLFNIKSETNKFVINLIFSAIVFIILMIYYFRLKYVKTSKQLLARILETKRIIRFYIIISVIYEIVSRLGKVYMNSKKVYSDTITIPYFLGTIVGTIIFIVLMYIFYKKTYGRFIKQLEENYQELSKIETQETSE